MTDPAVREEASSILNGVFTHIGSSGSQASPLGGLVDQFTQLMEMPIELAQIFLNMSMQLTELVLKSLEEAGITLVKGITPM